MIARRSFILKINSTTKIDKQKQNTTRFPHRPAAGHWIRRVTIVRRIVKQRVRAFNNRCYVDAESVWRDLKRRLRDRETTLLKFTLIYVHNKKNKTKTKQIPAARHTIHCGRKAKFPLKNFKSLKRRLTRNEENKIKKKKTTTRTH